MLHSSVTFEAQETETLSLMSLSETLFWLLIPSSSTQPQNKREVYTEYY